MSTCLFFPSVVCTWITWSVFLQRTQELVLSTRASLVLVSDFQTPDVPNTFRLLLKCILLDDFHFFFLFLTFY